MHLYFWSILQNAAKIWLDFTHGMPNDVTETDKNNEFLKRFKNFNITTTEQDINKYVVIDNESTRMFREEILEAANFFLKISN